MANSIWLDLRRSSSGEPVLLEYHTPYRAVIAESEKCLPLILLMRGRRHSHCTYLTYPGNQIHLRRIEAPRCLVVECGLHLLPTMAEWERGNHHARSLISHHQMTPGHTSARDIALRLYSQLLSLFSAVIIIIEEDFGGLAAVFHELAMWVISFPRTPSRIRPRVKIVTAQRTHASKRLEWELTVEILTNFNPFRELSFKAADSLWRGFFGGIEHISEPQSIGELYRTVPSMALHPRIGAYQLTELLRVALRQFCRCQKQPFSLISAVRANRRDPAPTEFPLVEALKGRVVSRGLETPALKIAVLDVDARVPTYIPTVYESVV